MSAKKKEPAKTGTGNRKTPAVVVNHQAVFLRDAAYFNRRGATLYGAGAYKQAVEYYHLAAAMGDVNAISNLGYCYLYGRDIEPDLSLAMAYFEVAVMCGNPDAAYKLGDIYGSDKWGVKDKEQSVYYYRKALSFITDEDWEHETLIKSCNELQMFPSLCYAMGRELSKGGAMPTDLGKAYQFLKLAEIGYRRELDEGNAMYAEAYEGVVNLLLEKQFNKVRGLFDTFGIDDDDLPF